MDHNNLCLGCMEEMGAGNTCPHCGYGEGAYPESLLHLPPGTVLQNKYLLGRVLGQGGFGITYLAWDKVLNIKLAIKEYLPQQLVTRTAGQSTVTVYKSSLAEEFRFGLNKFLEEARTLARFNEHPNIVTVREYFEANNTAYLVMNYHEGVTLQGYLESKGGKIPIAHALEIFMPVLDALKEVHAAGILHRDISPDNLLINTEGRVILIDFGAARQAMSEKSKSLSVIMKAGYSPPEQYQSRGKQGPWTDIYAVAATIYRALTGQAPLEAIDRMAEDDLVPPAHLGVAIDPGSEKALLRALAINTADRYQAVEDFQKSLLASGLDIKAKESAFASGAVKPSSKQTSGKLASQEKPPPMIKTEPASHKVAGLENGGCTTFGCRETAYQSATGDSLEISFDELTGSRSAPTRGGGAIRLLTAALVTSLLVLVVVVLAYINLLRDSAAIDDPAASFAGTVAEETPCIDDSAFIATLDADYYIDYENGTIPIGDLPIGARVVDPSWEWEFRTGNDYTRKPDDKTKPVTWIIMAKDHYSDLGPHVTLLSEELIGKHAFDNSTASRFESSHWGQSGTANATRGLRPWLNSSGLHAGEGFYQAFSESFKGAVFTTAVPNRERLNGSAYSTIDKVFIPSTTEMGDTEPHYYYSRNHKIGSAFPYFYGTDNLKRIASLGGERLDYWTRSPHYGTCDARVLSIDFSGGVYDLFTPDPSDYSGGVRPVLNLDAEILASEIK